jgi:predicted RNase H-like HicB family nuclease
MTIHVDTRLHDQRKDEKSMRRTFTASLWQEGEWFIAQCREVDVASQGETEEEALDNLRDALELHFTPPVATVAPQIRTVEVEVAA